MIGPCEAWIDPEDVFDCTPCNTIEEQDEALAQQCAEAASELLYYWSGRRFTGACEVLVAPCRRSACWTQVMEGGIILDTGMCECGAQSPPECGCPEPSTVKLPGHVNEVTTVTVDGETLTADHRTLQEHRYLIRTDGGVWPTCQDLADPSFTVAYTRGLDAPESGKLAAVELACEFYRGCSGGDCAIPENTVSLVRQGLSLEFVRPSAVGLRDGVVTTGLRRVSLFLSAFPQRKRSRIHSPDVGREVRYLPTS